MWANCLKSSFFVCSSLCKPNPPTKIFKKIVDFRNQDLWQKYFSCILCITAGPSSQQQSISSKKFPPFNIWSSKAYISAATTVVVFCYCVWNSCLFHILRHDLYTRDSISSFLATMVHFLSKTFLSCNL